MRVSAVIASVRFAHLGRRGLQGGLPVSNEGQVLSVGLNQRQGLPCSTSVAVEGLVLTGHSGCVRPLADIGWSEAITKLLIEKAALVAL